jgi:hypothetical protein
MLGSVDLGLRGRLVLSVASKLELRRRHVVDRCVRPCPVPPVDPGRGSPVRRPRRVGTPAVSESGIRGVVLQIELSGYSEGRTDRTLPDCGGRTDAAICSTVSVPDCAAGSRSEWYPLGAVTRVIQVTCAASMKAGRSTTGKAPGAERTGLERDSGQGAASWDPEPRRSSRICERNTASIASLTALTTSASSSPSSTRRSIV